MILVRLAKFLTAGFLAAIPFAVMPPAAVADRSSRFWHSDLSAPKAYSKAKPRAPPPSSRSNSEPATSSPVPTPKRAAM